MADQSLKHTIQKRKTESKKQKQKQKQSQKNTTLITNGPQTRDLHFLPSRLAPFQFFLVVQQPASRDTLIFLWKERDERDTRQKRELNCLRGRMGDVKERKSEGEKKESLNPHRYLDRLSPSAQEQRRDRPPC
jgi:hypothetical protein